MTLSAPRPAMAEALDPAIPTEVDDLAARCWSWPATAS